MNTVTIVQARAGSARFPNKVMREVCGVPVIGLLLTRLARAQQLGEVIVATSTDARNEPLIEYVRGLGYRVFEGSEDDVLDRYYRVAAAADAEAVVRITGDCPLIDPELVDDAIARFRAAGADYATNTEPPTYPDGLDIEVIRFAALERAWQEVTDPAGREHVTVYIRENPDFVKLSIVGPEDWSHERWTVDEPEDLDVIRNVFEHFHPNRTFSWRDVIELRQERPEFFASNRHLIRDEGANMGTGQKLWRRAKRIIPGGSMLLSKRAEMFLPAGWPTYFSRARGCRVWDLDGSEYIDMSMMGIGTNVLGYGHQEVDDAVRRAIDAGNMCTLNCAEEVLLAERLIELHPWAELVRFARTGGEAAAVAIRIARASAARDRVAVCGYHGWHDWYLAANLADENSLDGHLLPGLAPAGVPRDLRGSVVTFNYNRLDELEILLTANPDIGVIMMEVQRDAPPQQGFLEKVRALADARDIVLIFDECSSGFRETHGGLHKRFGVEPDLAVFGKALGNGYAITAVIGRRAVMEAAQTSFISSTFWTERIGPAAALATIDVMTRIESWCTIQHIGNTIMTGWRSLAGKHGLTLRISGLPSLASFSVGGDRALAYKTLITQEMLRRGYLAGTAVYPSIAHEPAVVDGYFAALDDVFALIAECEAGRDVHTLLRSPVCHSGFLRLT